MHARHLNGPSNGYRSNVIGMDMASASRIPSESSMRGPRMYRSDQRNYSRGGHASGGHSKQFQSRVPPPRAPAIFVEAGRLAAEYLVSKGVLPSSVLSGKWPNDGLKNVANFQGFRPHEVEVPVDGRASIYYRLGNVSVDMGLGRSRYSDDSSSTGSRGFARERKRTGLVKRFVPDVNRDSSHSPSRAEKASGSLGLDDASVMHRDERSTDKEGKGGTRNLSPGEVAQEVESKVHVGSGLKKSKISKDEKKDEATCSQKSQLHAADGERLKTHDGADEFKKESNESEVKERTNGEGTRQKPDDTKMVKREDDMLIDDHIDLVKHIKSANVPTRARSSLAGKNAKSDQVVSKNKHVNVYERDLPEDSGVNTIDVDIESAAGDVSLRQNSDLKSSNESSFEGNLDVTERPIYKEPEADEELSEFERSNSMRVERNVKRSIELSTEVEEGVKRLRQWVPMLDAQSDGSNSLCSTMDDNSLLQEPKTSQSAHSTQLLDQKGLNAAIFQKDLADSSELMEEKQLFPGSFKTCDLNRIGNADVGENHSSGSMLVFPSIMQSGKETMPIDVDLSISNNGNVPNKNGKIAVSANEIEVIDLENDSAPEEKAFSNPERRGDAVFTDLDGFSNSAHNTSGIPDGQDGYGLMISELLGHDNPNCSVPTDLNSLHNHMDLPNTEGILGDDDSIYMSLGEIPISLLGPWEQPTQDYGKPF